MKQEPKEGDDLDGLPENLVFSPLRVHTDHLADRIDRLFRKEMWLLTQLLPRILVRLGRAALEENIEAKREINALMLNANTTTLAALELWRRGFPLQVGILLRNVIETLATATALNGDAKAYNDYKRGSFRSYKAFSIVKGVWPVVGEQLARVNGMLSEDFTHIGALYQRWQSVSPDLNEADIVGLKAMLLGIKATFHTLDLLSELTCYEFTDERRYWTRVRTNAYQYQPTAEGEKWMRTFLAEEELK